MGPITAASQHEQSVEAGVAQQTGEDGLTSNVTVSPQTSESHKIQCGVLATRMQTMHADQLVHLCSAEHSVQLVYKTPVA